MEQFGGTFTAVGATPTFAPNTAGPVLLKLNDTSDSDAQTITVRPLLAGWECTVVVQQPADGDVAITWANVTWFGGTPAIATGANAKTMIKLFSPDGVTVYGFGAAAVAGLTVPQAAPAEYTITSSQNSTAAAVDLTTSEALANALKTSYNAAQTDIVGINTVVNNLIAALTTAGVL